MVREDFLEEGTIYLGLGGRVGHCAHECDGCFKGSKGCIELEGIGKGFVEMALKAEWDSNTENDIPGLL